MVYSIFMNFSEYFLNVENIQEYIEDRRVEVFKFLFNILQKIKIVKEINYNVIL